jgi:predicted DCC family thiol-disulfide oxidoreductase YuxK
VAATLFYDPDCAFCTRAAAAIGRRAAAGGVALDLAPIRSAAGDRLLGALPAVVRDGSWHLALVDGTVVSAGAAVAPLLRLLPGRGSRLAAAVAEALPGPVAAGYRLVARNRALLSRLGGGERCDVPR